MKTGWNVAVKGSHHGVTVARQQFEGDPYVHFSDEDGTTFLWTPRLGALPENSDGHEVHRTAQEELRMVNGALALEQGSEFANKHSLSAAHPSYKTADGRKHVVILAEAIEFNVTMGTSKVLIDGVEAPRQETLSQKWRRLADTDPVAREVLYYLGQEQTFPTMYKLLELMGMDRWAEKEGVVPNGFTEQLKQTANNYHQSGRQGRHADLNQGKPKKPGIGRPEAESHIRTMATAWLNKRL